MNRIYLDNAATTKPAPEVIEFMAKAQEKYWGNPSSIHTFGQEARRVVDDARRLVSFFIGCEQEEVIFTSGGSESDNLAIRGIISSVIPAPDQVEGKTPAGIQTNKELDSGSQATVRNDTILKPHVITSAVEHHAVLHTVQELEKEGKIEATYIKPDGEGLITPEMVKAAIRDNTILVSIIYVNNETGVVTPIREIGLMLEVENNKRLTINPTQPPLEKGRSKRIYFHTDAVQAAEFFEISPEYLKVDLLSLTAHKFHGPRGIGVLYVKKGTPVKAQITGGDHEFRLRAGTENTPAIAGLAKAVDLILKERDNSINTPPLNPPRKGGEYKENGALPELIISNECLRLSNLRDKLIQGIVEQIPDAYLNGSEIRRSPNIVNISFFNAEGEAIVLNLDFMGIAVSSGSACTSRSLDPSHVLSAMGIPPEKAHGSIRFSLSRETTEEEIDKVLEVLPGIIDKLRLMSPFN
ncbi:MAG: cysteine desulfurase family protein [Patescibacteria group bacterium]